jgi:hypothetical protein
MFYLANAITAPKIFKIIPKYSFLMSSPEMTEAALL